ncbi:MAG: HEAT repeat domain-containing protein, partial [Elusimicrobiota bacterium]
LIDSLKLESLVLKAQAISSLGKIGNSKAVTPILKHVDHKSPRIRFVSARALGDIGSERARVPLESRHKLEKNNRIRLEIGRSLKEISNAIFNLKFDMDAMMEDILQEQKRKGKR